MKEEIKKEAQEQLELDIKFGFDNEKQIFEGIREMFYDEQDFDENWLREAISEKYNQHEIESSTWAHPTDFERLAETFDHLIKKKIVCIHKAGYTKSDGEGDCMEIIQRLNEIGIKAIGLCYYHSQDLGRAIDPNVRNLFLGFDSPTQNDDEALFVAHRIVDNLKRNGFEVSWPETVAQRIEIKNLDWKKIPDNQVWDGERVLQILAKPKKDKKPFWKIW